MGTYKVTVLGHNINHKKDKDPIIKIDFIPDEDEYQDLVNDLTILSDLKLVINEKKK